MDTDSDIARDRDTFAHTHTNIHTHTYAYVDYSSKSNVKWTDNFKIVVAGTGKTVLQTGYCTKLF